MLFRDEKAGRFSFSAVACAVVRLESDSARRPGGLSRLTFSRCGWRAGSEVR